MICNDIAKVEKKIKDGDSRRNEGTNSEKLRKQCLEVILKRKTLDTLKSAPTTFGLQGVMQRGRGY